MVLSQRQKDLIEEDEDTNQLLGLSDNYDTTPDAGVDGLYGMELNDGLTESEMMFASRLALLSRGVMIVHGTPGCGKGVFANYLTWKIRRIFKGRKVILDYHPKPPFDYGYYKSNPYKYFDGTVMMQEIRKMAVEAGDRVEEDDTGEAELKKKDEKTKFEQIAKDWSKSHETVLKNAIQVQDELKRIFHNRRPNNKLGMMESNIVSVWRHLGLLHIGMCPNIKEIDINGYLQYVTHEVKPEWCHSFGKKDKTLCRIRRKASVGVNGVVQFESKPYSLFVDGARPRPEIGVQLMRTDLVMGEPEKRIVDILQDRKGYANLNVISRITDEDINECSARLIYMHGKYIEEERGKWVFTQPIKCMRIYDIYDSKDMKNLNPKLSKSEE
jgi:hypothetical protein